MKRKRFTEEQIIAVLGEHEAGSERTPKLSGDGMNGPAVMRSSQKNVGTMS